MVNPYVEYYGNQAGSGLTAFEGYEFQRGHGFFGSLFTNIIKPLGRYLGKTLLNTGVNLGADVLNGENFRESLKKNLKATGEQVLDDGYARAKQFAQTGKGRRRRRRVKVKKNKKKVLKKKPSLKKQKPKKKRSTRKFNFGNKFGNNFENIFK